METSKLKFSSSRKNMFFIIIGKQLPTSDRNASLQFFNEVKVPSVITFELTRILLQSISNVISGSNNWKDKDSLNSKNNTSHGNSVILTGNNYSINDCTKIISYKSISISSTHQVNHNKAKINF